LARLGSPLADLLHGLLQHRDAVAYAAPVDLELRLAGAPGADPAAEAAHRLAAAGQPRELVLELRQLDLHLRLATGGVLGEDVEDHLGAVEDLQLRQALDLARLRRRELAVEHQQVRVLVERQRHRLLQLALADDRAVVGFGAPLDGRGGYGRARAAHQLGQLGHARGRLGVVWPQAHEHGALLAGAPDLAGARLPRQLLLE